MTGPAGRDRRTAVAGAVAALVALGTGELVAGVLRAPSPVVEVGDRVVALAPGGVVEGAIALLGTADRPALLAGIVVLSVLFGAGIAWLARGDLVRTTLGFAVFGVIGIAATMTDPRATAVPALLPSGLAVLAAALTLRSLLPPGTRTSEQATGMRLDRRVFVRRVAWLGVAAGSGGLVGRVLQQRSAAFAARAELTLPPPGRALPGVPAAAELDLEGLSPVITPNDRFYRIDTALQVPQVDPGRWRLRVTGMVDRPLELTLDDLLGRDLVEADVTLACVSNEVGGSLVGNARWLGARLDDLLAEAGVQDGADQLVGRAVDGFTVGFPTALARDGRDALVAVGMNGEPLPVLHGFPARLVVPGLYGYVSATKWLAEIELTTWDGFDAYWIPRGWSKEAPIKTQSRIDVPRAGAEVTAGTVAVAGVAWAPTRGIARVEVRVDDGPWREATLAAAIGPDTWRQWRWDWDAAPGDHVLWVRATDGEGDTQTEEQAAPIPDGATGWHRVGVRVQEG